MSAAKHTPGPWSISMDSDLWPMVMGGGNIVANINPESFSAGVADLVEMPSMANARLIAASPKLLAALKSLCEIQKYGDVAGWRQEWDDAKEAIEEAEGR